jgi:hypothetical protein
MSARTEPLVAITIDVDWAPDACIDAVASLLLDAGVNATWFLTHDSPAVSRLRQHAPHFELAWHPNFFPGSTHGASEHEVLAYCGRLAPEATVMRTHGLLQSTRLLDTLRRTTGIRTDVSLLLRHQPSLTPHLLPLPSGALLRVPFWWEDDIEMHARDPLWHLAQAFHDGAPGWRVLNFHPIHVMLEAHSMVPYESLKQRFPVLAAATGDDVAAMASDDKTVGAGRAFRDAVAWLAARGGGETISTLAAPLLERA